MSVAENLKFPEELLYSVDHEWVRIDGEEAIIGITDFAQSELGEIVFVDVDTEGEEVAAGSKFGAVEAVKTVSDLIMPLTGTVLEVNPALEDNPAAVNSDPYGEGWMIRVKLAAPGDTKGLLSAQGYKDHIQK